MDPAVEGRGGDRQTFRVACVLVIDFGLSPEEALPVLLEFNQRCSPPWSLEALWHKLLMALGCAGNQPRGGKVRRQSNVITIALRPGDPVVYIGVDCAGEGRSYVDLQPSAWAGLVKVGSERELASELERLDWSDKQVVLTPPSTIATSKNEVWAEFFLARLLRERGADVRSLHLPPLQGRRRTYSQAEGTGTLVVPPRHAWQATAQAEDAATRAGELDAYRRTLPRQKTSPKLAKAHAFIQKHAVHRLTKEVVLKAKKHGVSRTTLSRALESQKTNPTAPPLSQSC
jgi:hypothetical protein